MARSQVFLHLLSIVFISQAKSSWNLVDSTRSWFDPTKQYLKLQVANDGIYRVTYEQLQNILPQNRDPRKLDLFFKGKSIPFSFLGDSDGVFGAGEYLEFYGSRNYDKPYFLNEFTDTAFYFLTFDGTGTQRARRDSIIVSPNVNVSTTSQVVHLERDSIYYFGDGGLPGNNQSDKVAGETWYWNRLFANQSVNIPFISTNFYKTGNPVYTIRGRFHSPVIQQATPNHSIDILVNGSTAGQILLGGYSDTTFNLGVSSTLFNEGPNTLTLRSNTTSASLNEILVDWLEIQCLKSLQADSDSLLFSGDQSLVGQVGRFQLNGFTTSSINCYRIEPNGGIDKVFSGAITGSAPNYSFEFTDTIQTGRLYFAIASSNVKSVSRLEKKTFLDLRSSANGADYLVITGKDLGPAANRLASYRAGQGIGRTKVVFAEDIYDEFSFGMFDPFAIRRFLLAIDTLWVSPRPIYLLLFGDANWDYKDIYRTDKRNIVPSLGNPVSDEWLVASKTDVFLPTKKVGRVPVQNTVEAESFVDMVMAYESAPLSLLNKRFMFMASGFDSIETTRFQQFSESLVSQNIAPAPIGGVPLRIYKTVQQIVDITKTEEVKRILQEGAVWINYFGHAGTDLWGNGITKADQLANKDEHRHLVSDISCSTARFAEPLTNSFGEKLLLAQTGGAVGYIGSSGFGFESPLRELASQMFKTFASDSVRDLGSLVLNAKVGLWQLGTSSILNQQSLQQWTLLGDPATMLAVPRKPDLALDGRTITISPSLPSESDQNVSLSVPVFNYGLRYADSTTVRISHNLPGDPDVFIDRKIPSIRYSDTLVFNDQVFARGGLHRIVVTVDPDRRINEVTTVNNSGNVTFFVSSGGSLAISPLNSSAVKPDSVFLSIQNPSLSPNADWKALFEIDTVSDFSSLGKIRQQGVAPGIVVTTFQVPTGVLQNDKLYFWRARFYATPDSTQWTGGSFITQPAPATWVQDRGQTFQKNSFGELSITPSVQLIKQNLAVEVYSAGFDDGLDASIFVNGVNLSQGFAGRGYNIAVMNQFSGKLESFASISIYSDVSDTMKAEPVLQFLQGIPFGRRVLVAVLDEGLRNKTERLNQAFESIGSGFIRSLGFRGSWAISGWKGASLGSVPEAISSAGNGSVTISDTLHLQSIRGSMVTSTIGPAAKWNAVAALVDTGGGKGRITFEVIRKKRTGTLDTVALSSLQIDTVQSILDSSVESIRLKANLMRGPSEVSPELKRWSVSFDPPSELTLNNRTVRILKDSVLEGDPITLEARVFNVGYAVSESVSVSLGVFAQNIVVPFFQTTIPKIAPGSSTLATSQFSTMGKPGRNVFFIQVDPERKSVELSSANNAISLPFTVLRDTVAPLFDVTFDGNRIFDGDYVGVTPEIRVSIRDNSPLVISNPSSATLKLNDRRITLGAYADSLFETKTGSEKVAITFRPRLERGNHVLSIQVSDASGNLADTSAMLFRFKVESDSRILQAFNYPNPFSDGTNFTFNLTGAKLPEELVIKIYTVAGRLIREMKVQRPELRFGFNSVSWDGRDADGSELANGVYFYKLKMQMDDKVEEVIQKLAKIR